MKRFYSLVLFIFVFSITLSPIYVYGDTQFTDVSQKHWAYDDIIDISSAGIITGYSDGSFKPNENVTVAEAVTMVVRNMNVEIISLPQGTIRRVPTSEQLTAKSIFGTDYNSPNYQDYGSNLYTSSKESSKELAIYDNEGNQQFVICDDNGNVKWWSPYATVAYQKGLLTQIYGSGHTDYVSVITAKQFRANAPCTRITMAKLLGKAMEAEGVKFDKEKYKYRFTDHFVIIPRTLDIYGAEMVDGLYEQGIVNGKTRDEFKYEDYLTRAELATIINRWVTPAKKLVVEDYVPMHNVISPVSDTLLYKYGSDEYLDWLIEGANQIRSEYGITALQKNQSLMKASLGHVNIMMESSVSNNTWHFGGASAPYGYSPFTSCGTLDSVGSSGMRLYTKADAIQLGRDLAMHSSQIGTDAQFKYIGVAIAEDKGNGGRTKFCMSVGRDQDLTHIKNKWDDAFNGIYPDQEMINYHRTYQKNNFELQK